MKSVAVRHHFDPVPFTGKGQTYRFNRRVRYPATMNEARQFFASNPAYARTGRNPKSLPDSWLELDRCLVRNWKSQCRAKRQHGFDQGALRGFKRT